MVFKLVQVLYRAIWHEITFSMTQKFHFQVFALGKHTHMPKRCTELPTAALLVVWKTRNAYQQMS
jgi:hypothetical protein